MLNNSNKIIAGVRGPKGDTGATGATGATGPAAPSITLATQYSLGTALTNSAAETDLVPTSGIIAANGLVLNDGIFAFLTGRITGIAASTLQFRWKIGGSAVTILDFGAVAIGVATNTPFKLLLHGGIRSVGAGGTFTGYGELRINGLAIDTQIRSGSIAIDTTVNNEFKVSGQWNTANVGNIVAIEDAFWDKKKV